MILVTFSNRPVSTIRLIGILPANAFASLLENSPEYNRQILQALEELAGRLSGLGGDSGSYSVRAISNLNGDASALEALEECSSVVIAAEVPKSTYRNTDDLLATVDAYGKTVAGSIVLC